MAPLAETQEILPEQEIAAAQVAVGFLRSAHKREVFLQSCDGFLEATGGGVGFA